MTLSNTAKSIDAETWAASVRIAAEPLLRGISMANDYNRLAKTKGGDIKCFKDFVLRSELLDLARAIETPPTTALRGDGVREALEQLRAFAQTVANVQLTGSTYVDDAIWNTLQDDARKALAVSPTSDVSEPARPETLVTYEQNPSPDSAPSTDSAAELRSAGEQGPFLRLPEWNDLPDEHRAGLCERAEYMVGDTDAEHMAGDIALEIYNFAKEHITLSLPPLLAVFHAPPSERVSEPAPPSSGGEA